MDIFNRYTEPDIPVVQDSQTSNPDIYKDISGAERNGRLIGLLDVVRSDCEPFRHLSQLPDMSFFKIFTGGARKFKDAVEESNAENYQTERLGM